MKIKGMDWMDWLHQVRAEAQEQRKGKRQTLAQYLRTIERPEGLEKKTLRPFKRRVRRDD